MPLTWDYTDTVLDSENDHDKALAEAAIFATMAVGINHITEANCLEFYKRISLSEKVTGAFRFQSVDGAASPQFFTPEDVVRLIGLRTNAGTMTRTQFNKHIVAQHERYLLPYGFKMPLDSRG